MNAHVLVIDNYDSFTFNLVQAIRETGARVSVVRNDKLDVDHAASLPFSHLLISPGPGRPAGAGICEALIRAVAGQKPILGVCLGLQAMVTAFGGEIVQSAKPMHGKSSDVHHSGHGLFAGMPMPFVAGRYHSLCAHRKTLPAGFEISAWTNGDEIMALSHREFDLNGVQFHPESILTPDGKTLIRNFLEPRTGNRNE